MRHGREETTIHARIEQARRRDPVLGFPNPVQGPLIALLAVHPLAWAACWAGLLALEPGERLPLWAPTLDSVMQGSLFFALALLAQGLTVLPPLLLALGAGYWGWVALGLAGYTPMLPLPGG